MRHADDCIYSIDKPYPEITVDKPNIRYVNLILPDYSGIISEYTAISQYIYHSFRTMEKYPKIANELHCISIVEMHHLEILAQLIIKLGGDPRFCISKKEKCYYWDSKFVQYKCTIIEMLESDIKAEEQAIKNYRKAISLIDDDNIKGILERIILDEELHLKIFTDLKKEVE